MKKYPQFLKKGNKILISYPQFYFHVYLIVDIFVLIVNNFLCLL
jgi:hypothetical protein